jgi:hypothetical protein
LNITKVSVICCDVNDAFRYAKDLAVIWLDHTGSPLKISEEQISRACNVMIPEAYLAITTSQRVGGGLEYCKYYLEGILSDRFEIYGHFGYGGSGPMLYTTAKYKSECKSQCITPTRTKKQKWYYTEEFDYDTFEKTVPSSRARCCVTPYTKKWACIACGRINEVQHAICQGRKCTKLRLQGVPIE